MLGSILQCINFNASSYIQPLSLALDLNWLMIKLLILLPIHKFRNWSKWLFLQNLIEPKLVINRCCLVWIRLFGWGPGRLIERYERFSCLNQKTHQNTLHAFDHSIFWPFFDHFQNWPLTLQPINRLADLQRAISSLGHYKRRTKTEKSKCKS